MLIWFAWCFLPWGRDDFPAHLLYTRNADVGRVVSMVCEGIDRDCLYDSTVADAREQEGKRKLKVLLSFHQ